MLSKDYLETTFVDIRPGSTLERKLLAEAQDLHSVSYSMDDEDDLLPDSDVRYPSSWLFNVWWQWMFKGFLKSKIVVTKVARRNRFFHEHITKVERIVNLFVCTKFLGPDLSLVKNIKYANFQTDKMKLNQLFLCMTVYQANNEY